LEFVQKIQFALQVKFFAQTPPSGILDFFRFARMTAAAVGPEQRPEWFLLAALLEQNITFAIKNEY
jgi:hypothetical protein